MAEGTHPMVPGPLPLTSAENGNDNGVDGVPPLVRSVSLLQTALLGLGFGIYSDFLSSGPLGPVLALGLFGVIILRALVRGLASGLEWFLIAMLLSPLVNRDMVQITELTGAAVTAHGLMTTRVVSFTLVQWGFLFFGSLSLFHQIRTLGVMVIPGAVRRVFLINLAILGTLSAATMVDAFVAREFIDLRALVSDLRFFIIVFFATFTALHFRHDPAGGRRVLERALLIAAIAGGIKASFFFVHDFLASRTSLYFNPQPYVFFPVFFALVYCYRQRITLRFTLMLAMSFLAAFSISRGDIFFALLCGLIFLVVLLFSPNSSRDRLGATRTLVVFFVGTALFVTLGIFFANPAAFKFLQYKASFFINVLIGQDIGQSASVRVYELKNIFAEGRERIYPLIIGKGFGSYFTFIRHPVPFPLGHGTFVPESLVQQRYFNPHGFIQYTFLKGGLLFCLYYLGLIASAFVLAISRLRAQPQRRPLLLVMLPFLCLFALNMFWRPPVIFLFFLVLNVLLMDKGNSPGQVPANESKK